MKQYRVFWFLDTYLITTVKFSQNLNWTAPKNPGRKLEPLFLLCRYGKYLHLIWDLAQLLRQVIFWHNEIDCLLLQPLKVKYHPVCNKEKGQRVIKLWWSNRTQGNYKNHSKYSFQLRARRLICFMQIRLLYSIQSS